MTLVSKDILQAMDLLNQDDLVAIPTETVYGLAGNIFSEVAVRKIYTLKQRPSSNPLIVHIKSFSEIEKITSHLPPKAKLLAEAFWPGELTLVLKKQAHIPDWITSGKDTVAVRVPNHPMTLELLEKLDYPLAAPSANPFGSISPTNPMHVVRYFDTKLKMVLDGGECKKGIESTIIGFENEEPVLYRLGALSVEEIEQITGPIQIKNKKDLAPEAPGMFSKHYSPLTPMFMPDNIAQFIKLLSDKRIGVLLFDNKMDSEIITHQEVLSPSGDLKEATSNLYAALHRLDLLKLDMIVAERFPDVGLGRSINDRLERACSRDDSIQYITTI